MAADPKGNVLSFAFVCVASMALACGPEVPTSTWEASDHARPEASETQVRPRARSQENLDPAEQRARAAATLFRVSCAACHGVEGTGDGPQGGGGLVSFRDPEWQASRSDEQIAEIITLGRGQMPAFGERILPEGIAVLVAHIRTLVARSDASDGEDEAPSGGEASAP